MVVLASLVLASLGLASLVFASLILASGSGESVSAGAVSAAVTTGSGADAAGVSTRLAGCVTARLLGMLAAATSIVRGAIGCGLSANLTLAVVTSAVRDCARRSTIGAAVVRSIPAKPD